MPTQSPIIFAFSGLYMGQYGQSTPLVSFPYTRTNGATIQETIPYSQFEQFNLDINQTENFKINVTLEFLTDNQYVTNLARGVGIGSAINAPPAKSHYAMLLMSPLDPIQSSYYFPNLYTSKVREVSYGKGKPTSTQIVFEMQSRTANLTMFYQDSLANLKTDMGSQSPY